MPRTLLRHEISTDRGSLIVENAFDPDLIKIVTPLGETIHIPRESAAHLISGLARVLAERE